MIWTVTLNPALDYVVRTEHFSSGRINRNQEEHIYFGGKGVNVSCILKELGAETKAVGFIAGFTGRALKDGLEELGIDADFVEVSSGMTRINVKIRSDDETEINGRGPDISEEDFQKLLEILKGLKQGDILVLSGSIPSCMGSDTYERILRETGPSVMFAADAEKELLQNILKYRPFLIKPNSIELGQMFDTEIRNDEEAVYYAGKLQEKGARNVLVSMASEGALLLDETGKVHRAAAARGTAVNSVGAGDSMLAGFLAGYLETGDYEYALKLGTACGGATAFHSGLASKEQIQEVLETL